MNPKLKRLTPEAIEYSQKRWTLIQRAREVMADDDPRDPNDLNNDALEQIVTTADGVSAGKEG